MVVQGNCLSPIIVDGAKLEFSSTERCLPGDFVAIYRHAAFVKPGEWQVIRQALVADLRKGDLAMPGIGPGVLAEMLNPPCWLALPLTKWKTSTR
jgi:hypothetical protein